MATEPDAWSATSDSHVNPRRGGGDSGNMTMAASHTPTPPSDTAASALVIGAPHAPMPAAATRHSKGSSPKASTAAKDSPRVGCPAPAIGITVCRGMREVPPGPALPRSVAAAEIWPVGPPAFLQGSRPRRVLREAGLTLREGGTTLREAKGCLGGCREPMQTTPSHLMSTRMRRPSCIPAYTR